MDPFLPAKISSTTSRRSDSISSDWNGRNGGNHNLGPSSRIATPTDAESEKRDTHQSLPNRMVNGGSALPKAISVPINRPNLIVSEKDFQAALARIDTMELSDVEGDAFDDQRQEFALRTAKRFRDIEDIEVVKCKVIVPQL